MSVDSFAVSTVTWLVTFAVHSTVLLGLAWLLASRLGRGAHRDEERWWKIALFAGILTASGQTALGIRPFTGELLIPAALTETVATATEKPPIETFEPATLSATSTPARAVRPRAAQAAPVTPKKAVALTATAETWVIRAVGFWIFCASLGLIALTLSWTRLSRLLRHRTQLSSSDGGQRGELYLVFEELSRKAGLGKRVRLSASNRLSSPITFGVFRREICLPHTAVYSLDVDEQRAMLAHELAHAKRHDPAWLLTINVLERVLFFQPLLRVARRRQQHIAEYLCDDWAVMQTGDPVSLASCLTEVAGWVVGHQRCQLAPSMAAAGMELDTRVRRILNVNKTPRFASLRYALLPLAFASCAGVLYGVPSLSTTPGEHNANREELAVRLEISPAGTPTGLSFTLESPDVPPTPEQLLAMLDAEFALLRNELESLRQEANAADADEHVHAVLKQIENSLHSLESRRERLALLLPQLSQASSTPAVARR